MSDGANFLRLVGAELRSLRLKADLSLESVAEVFGWNRDAISKIERGQRNMLLSDYLTLMLFYRDLAPGHPALALAARFKKGKSR